MERWLQGLNLDQRINLALTKALQKSTEVKVSNYRFGDGSGTVTVLLVQNKYNEQQWVVKIACPSTTKRDEWESEFLTQQNWSQFNLAVPPVFCLTDQKPYMLGMPKLHISLDKYFAESDIAMEHIDLIFNQLIMLLSKLSLGQHKHPDFHMGNMAFVDLMRFEIQMLDFGPNYNGTNRVPEEVETSEELKCWYTQASYITGLCS